MKSIVTLIPESLKTMFNNPEAIVPLLIPTIISMTLMGMGKNPFMDQRIWMGMGFLKIAMFVLVLFGISLFINGWSFKLIGQAVNKRKVELFVFDDKVWMIMLTLLVHVLFFSGLIFGMVLLGGIYAVLVALVPFLALLLIVIIPLGMAISFVIVAYYFLVLGAMMVDSPGPIESLVSAGKVFRKHFWRSILVAVIPLILGIIAYMPTLVYMFVRIPGFGTQEIVTIPAELALPLTLISIPYILVGFWTLFYVASVYKDSKGK
jgi:hypothetical protein